MKMTNIDGSTAVQDLIGPVSSTGRYNLPNNIVGRQLAENFGEFSLRIINDATNSMEGQQTHRLLRLIVKLSMIDGAIADYTRMMDTLGWWKSASETSSIAASLEPLKVVHNNVQYPIFENVLLPQYQALISERSDLRRLLKVDSLVKFIPTFTFADFRAALDAVTDLSKSEVLALCRSEGAITGVRSAEFFKTDFDKLITYFMNSIDNIPEDTMPTDMLRQITGAISNVPETRVIVDMDVEVMQNGLLFLPFTSESSTAKVEDSASVEGAMHVCGKDWCALSADTTARNQIIGSFANQGLEDWDTKDDPANLSVTGYIISTLVALASGKLGMRSLQIPLCFSPVSNTVSEVLHLAMRKSLPTYQSQLIETLIVVGSQGAKSFKLQALLDTLNEQSHIDRQALVTLCSQALEVDVQKEVANAIKRLHEKRGTYTSRILSPDSANQFRTTTSASDIRANGQIVFNCTHRADVITHHVTGHGEGIEEALIYVSAVKARHVMDSTPMSKLNPLIEDMYNYADVVSPDFTLTVGKAYTESRMVMDGTGPLLEFSGSRLVPKRLSGVLSTQIAISPESDIQIIDARTYQETMITPIHQTPFHIERQDVRLPTGYISIGYASAMNGTRLAKSVQQATAEMASDLYAAYTLTGVPSLTDNLTVVGDVKPQKYLKRMEAFGNPGTANSVFDTVSIDPRVYTFANHPATENFAQEFIDPLEVAKLAYGTLFIQKRASNMLDRVIDLHIRRWVMAFGLESNAITNFRNLFSGVMNVNEMRELQRREEVYAVVNVMAALLRRVAKDSGTHLTLVVMSKLLTRMDTLVSVDPNELVPASLLVESHTFQNEDA